MNSAILIAKYGIDAYVFGRIPGHKACSCCGLGFKTFKVPSYVDPRGKDSNICKDCLSPGKEDSEDYPRDFVSDCEMTEPNFGL